MIIMICSAFPFKGGEPFLINEIKYFSQIDENMIIYPIEVDNGEYLLNIPDNVKVRTLKKKRGIQAILTTLFSADFWKEFYYLIKDKPPLKKICAMIFYQININNWYNLIYKDLQKQLVKKTNIIVYSYWMHVHACIASRLKKKYKDCKFVTRCHGYDLYEYRANSGYLPERRLIFNSADIIASVSNQGIKYLKHQYSWMDRKKLLLSYLGTYDRGINIDADNTIKLVSCSNLVPLKRVELLINALSNIDNIEIFWNHYGDGPLRNYLEKLAEDKLPPNIHYSFKGFINNDELMEEYKHQSFKLFIHASETEGLPVCFMEAMSFGIPILCTDVGGCTEIVADGGNGLVVPKDVTALEFSKKILWYINLDEISQKRFHENARRTWEEKFDANQNYDIFYHMLRNL